jgi:PEGA domain
MITLKSAGRLRHKALPLTAAALLVASLTAEAQQRSRPSDSGDTGRSAREVGSRSSNTPSPSNAPRANDSSRQPRTARPSDGGEPQRQPSHRRGDNDGRRHGGGYHGGYYGGYYGPYYSPYGFWPRFWWGWYGDPYYYPHPYYGGQPTYYGEGDAGALDLDVAPGRTEVYLDGERIGTVDAFDGWPRYLWLRKGTYDLVFYLDGYKTVARQITVYPGTVIDVNDRLEPGDSTRPEDLISKSTERRDERLRYERERREELDRGRRGDDRRGDYGEDWRDRVRRDRGRYEGQDDGRDREDGAREESGRRGRLLLDVEPEDASVYLDGRFVGTGTELSLMRSGLPVSPGEHKLSIVRPGRRAEEREFTVKAGEEVELEVELESESR